MNRKISIASPLAVLSALALMPAALTAAEFHVSVSGNDAGDGTKTHMLRTISAAARLAQPGDVVTVHEGVYRERVAPPRGGESDTKRIVYQSAPGENVVVTGSEVVKHWQKVQGDAWKLTLPNKFFGDFNPYADLIHGDWYGSSRPNHTGAVYLNGDWLLETPALDDVLSKTIGKLPLWHATVDGAGTTIWAQFPGVDPNRAEVEINVRKTVFSPEKQRRQLYHPPRFHASQRRHELGPAHRRADRHGFRLLVQRLDHREQRHRLLHLLRDRTGQVRRRVGQSRRVGRGLCRHTDAGTQERLEQEHGRRSHGAQQPHPPLRADGRRRQPRLLVQHRDRQRDPRHPRPRSFWRGRNGRHQVPRGHRRRDRGQPHLPLRRRRRHLAGLDGPGRAGERQLAARQRQRHLLRDAARPAAHRQQPLLSRGQTILFNSQGIAVAHNLIAGPAAFTHFDGRDTPFHRAHSTEIAGLHNAPSGDHRFYNNVFQHCDLRTLGDSMLPCFAAGNVFVENSQPSKFDVQSLVKADFATGMKLLQTPGGWYLTIAEDPAWRTAAQRKTVTTELLGKAAIPQLSYENADGTPLHVATDYFGNPRNAASPFPGPFELPVNGKQAIRVWPIGESPRQARR